MLEFKAIEPTKENILNLEKLGFHESNEIRYFS